VPLVQDFLQTNLCLIISVLNNEMRRQKALLKQLEELNLLYTDLYRSIIEYDTPPKLPSQILTWILPIFSSTSGFYSVFGFVEKEKLKFPQKYVQMSDSTPLYLIDNINFFGEQGGFEAISKRLTWILEGKIINVSLEDISTIIKSIALIQEKKLFEQKFGKNILSRIEIRNVIITYIE